MSFTKSLTLIVPAAQRDAANKLMCALRRDTMPGKIIERADARS